MSVLSNMCLVHEAVDEQLFLLVFVLLHRHKASSFMCYVIDRKNIKPTHCLTFGFLWLISVCFVNVLMVLVKFAHFDRRHCNTCTSFITPQCAPHHITFCAVLSVCEYVCHE